MTTNSAISQLFEMARQNGGAEYLFTLVRVDGLQCYKGYKDELEALREFLSGGIHAVTPLEGYQSLASDPHALNLIMNLLNCCNRKRYELSPFRGLGKGEFPNYVSPSLAEKIAHAAATARLSNMSELADALESAYAKDLLPASESVTHAQPDQLALTLMRLKELLTELLEKYAEVRRAFLVKTPKYYKWPNFEVLELIIDEDAGLSGFRIHFSNDCSSTFTRSATGTVAEHLVFGPPLNFMITSTGPLKREWRVNGKSLWEMGLPGRYNTLGYWKPLVYPAPDIDDFMKECVALSDDPEVQATLLYARLTCHHCIEFVLRTNLELPPKYSTGMNGKLHFWKCGEAEKEGVQDEQNEDDNIQIYDGWLQLDGITVEDIEIGITNIGRFISLMCFPFGVDYVWRVKYKTTGGSKGRATPSKEDMKIVDDVMTNFPSGEGGALLETALDWYNRGNSAKNVFTSFLSYYVAVESVASAMGNGTDLGFVQQPKPDKNQRRSEKIACIQQKYDALFSENPIEFVTKAYSECVMSLKKQTVAAVKAVFGDGHRYVKLLFEPTTDGDPSLSDIRNKLAHGDVTHLDRKDVRLVWKRAGSMEEIAREFLFRIIFGLKPSDALPSWSREHRLTLSTSDPRSTLWCTELSWIPEADWKIKVEWCDAD